MPRATYIYLVRRIADREVLGAFTVKYEAAIWARSSGESLETLQLSRMNDGSRQKQETSIPWEGRRVGRTLGVRRSE